MRSDCTENAMHSGNRRSGPNCLYGISHAPMPVVRAIARVDLQKFSIRTPFSFGIQALAVWAMLWVILVQAHAQVITAASANWYDVSNACAEASNGWTVVVPPGTAYWNAGFTITNKGIFLKGASYYPFNSNVVANANPSDTEVVNEISGSEPLITVYLTYTNLGFFRLSGFHFVGGVTNQQNDPGDEYPNIKIIGTDNLANNSEWRVDHCFFQDMTGPNVACATWNGLIDNCAFWQINNGDTIQIHPSPTDIRGNNLGDICGDISWANPIAIGTVDEGIYVENCYFTNNSYRAAVDDYDGGKLVFRHNWVEVDGVQTHGTESSGPYRGGRWEAVYDCTFNAYVSGGGVVYCRSGTGVCFSNTCSGPWPAMVQADMDRMFEPYAPWGIADGTSPWDDNVTNANGTTKYFAGGTCGAGSGDDFMVDSSAHWTINQWAGYSIVCSNQSVLIQTTNGVNVNCMFGGIITSNGPNTITTFPAAASGISPDLVWTSGQVYFITKINHQLDQPGIGYGNLLTPSPPGPTFTPVTWPNEVDTPWWIWGNTGSNSEVGNFSTNANGDPYYVFTPGRNWTNAVDTAYVQLQFPDPWTTNYSTNVVSYPPNFTLTVVNGVGSGSYASNSVVSVSANETSNQTFAYWAGADIANTNAASTTVTMPASNLTVTAYYTPYPPGNLNVAPGP